MSRIPQKNRYNAYCVMECWSKWVGWRFAYWRAVWMWGYPEQSLIAHWKIKNSKVNYLVK